MSSQAQQVDPMRRIREVQEITGLSRSNIYVMGARGTLPPPMKIGPRASAWPESELIAVNAARKAGHSEDEIRALVKRLIAKRATAADAIA